jgi:hypothetical protein
MKQSTQSEVVFYIEKGEVIEDHPHQAGWYWFDECGLLANDNPYPTEDAALKALFTYIRML